MKLAELTAKPQLKKITIDDEAIVESYGEPIDFWVYDRQPMDTFMKLATVEKDNAGGINEVVKQVVLDETGKPILKDGSVLPIDVMMKVVTKVVDSLGNPAGQTTKK